MFSAIILGGGSGQRMRLGYNKVLYKIKGLTVIEHAAKAFIEDPDFQEVIVVMNRDDFDQVNVLFHQSKVKVVKGGNTRQESVFIGLKHLAQHDYVMIHDGARPNPSKTSIEALKHEVLKHPAILFTPSKDSLVLNNQGKIDRYLNREEVACIKTPQAFKTEDIIQAYHLAKDHQHTYKDDASVLMHELKQDIYLVKDDESNIKLTTRFDLRVMEELL